MMALGVVMDANHLEKFAKLVAAEEREACAKVCDELEQRFRKYTEELKQEQHQLVYQERVKTCQWNAGLIRAREE
jgi:hypothetical protein